MGGMVRIQVQQVAPQIPDAQIRGEGSVWDAAPAARDAFLPVGWHTAPAFAPYIAPAVTGDIAPVDVGNKSTAAAEALALAFARSTAPAARDIDPEVWNGALAAAVTVAPASVRGTHPDVDAGIRMVRHWHALHRSNRLVFDVEAPSPAQPDPGQLPAVCARPVQPVLAHC